MAATDPDRSAPSPGTQDAGGHALIEHLDEEIGRAERHGTGLSCLLVVIDDVEHMVSEHGRELPAQTLAYLADTLRPELRRFDRVCRPSHGELLIVLPGADGPRGEMVARRVLERVRTIKVEAGGTRTALNLSVGLAAWRSPLGPHELLTRARAAARAPGPESKAGEGPEGAHAPAGAPVAAAPADATGAGENPAAVARATRS